jgi:hypothetical protein
MAKVSLQGINNDYMAFDPGKRTGWATFDAHGLLTLFGVIIGEDDLMEFLEDIQKIPKVIIVEDYIINPNIRQGGRRPVASEAIGIISSFAKRKKVTLVRQPNTCLSSGLKWAGLEKPKGHLPDAYSAIAHGTFYVQSKGIRPDEHLVNILKQKGSS